MYNNIGSKIKGLVKLIVYGGILLLFIGGWILFFVLLDRRATEDIAFIGIIIAFIGPVICWLSGFFLYGFGELIDQTQQINNILALSNKESIANEKIAKLKEWREKDLITEEEYREKLSVLWSE